MNRPVPLAPFMLIAGCAVLLALLTAGSARRGLPRPLLGVRAFLFRYNLVFRWAALAAAVLIPIGLTVLLGFHRPDRPDVPYLLGLYLVIAALTTPLIWEAGRYYLLVAPAGLEGRSAWRGIRFIPWDDLEAVGYSPFNAWFEFRGRDGVAIRARSFVAGLNDLLQMVESNVPAAAMTPARKGYARVGRPFPALPDEPVLEARRPRRVGEW